MTQKPTPKTGLARILAAFGYSLAGLRHALLHAVAFRQEAILFLLMAIALCFLPLRGEIKTLLLAANSLVLVAELLNSAVEAVVDLASPDYHLLAKQAKDLGSGAVLVALLLAAGLWGWAIFPLLGAN